MWEPYAQLFFQNRPVDLIVINSSDHVLSSPAARLASQGGDVDWFRCYEDPDQSRSERTAVHNILVQAQSAGLIGAGDPTEMGGRYLALLWGDLMVSVLLRIREAPGTTEIDHRVIKATEDFLRLYSEPKNRARHAAPRDRSNPRR
jgi:hypothetical protein